MIDKLMKYAKEQQGIGKIITRADIQFNYKTNSYSARVWYSDNTCIDIRDCESVNVEVVKC